MELNEILRKIRRDANVSQENVADEIGVDATTYGRYERGEAKIKLEHAKKLAAFYKISLDDLYRYGETVSIASEPLETIQQETLNDSALLNTTIMVTLDGTPRTLNNWIKKLSAINEALLKTA